MADMVTGVCMGRKGRGNHHGKDNEGHAEHHYEGRHGKEAQAREGSNHSVCQWTSNDFGQA
ncbi:hypothetical protein BDR03DRAFT_963789 [Suillus americanus]|nr:hypothetical protein BDR03DRAFT_963789 [Suillus americanus]